MLSRLLGAKLTKHMIKNNQKVTSLESEGEHSTRIIIFTKFFNRPLIVANWFVTTVDSKMFLFSQWY